MHVFKIRLDVKKWLRRLTRCSFQLVREVNDDLTC